MSRLPRQPSGGDLKFPNPFEKEHPPDKRTRGSLPILPSVGLGPDEPEEAKDPAWDPLKSRKDDSRLPDKPITWRRRLTWPGLAVLCGLLLIASAYFLVEFDDSDDDSAGDQPVILDLDAATPSPSPDP